MEDCISVQTNATKVRVMWKEHAVLENIPNIIQIRFYLKKGKLYSFWITDSDIGKSHGYLAAGSLRKCHGHR